MAKSFIFGEGTGVTYASLKQSQAQADRMMLLGSSPRHKTPVGGLTSAANSIIGALMSKKLGKQKDQLDADWMEGAQGSGLDAAHLNILKDMPHAQRQAYMLSRMDKKPTGGPSKSDIAGAETQDILRGMLFNRGGKNSTYSTATSADPSMNGGFQPGADLGFSTGAPDTPTTANMESWGANGQISTAPMGNSGEATKMDSQPGLSFGQMAPQQQPQNGLNAGMVQDLRMQALTANPALSKALMQKADQIESMLPEAVDPMDAINLETAQFGLDALRNPAPEERGSMTAADGYKYYVDDGSRVFPGVQAPADNGAPKITTLTRDDGSEVAVQWNTQTQEWDPINAPGGGGTADPKNKKLTENQSKLTLFQSLQTESQPVLLDLEKRWNPANLSDATARATPIAGNFYQTQEGQIYNAAASSWAEGALRIATGAAATPEEMERTKTTYFAQPGDKPPTVMFKAQMREMYARSIQRALGETVKGSLPLPSDFAKQFDGGDGGGVANVPQSFISDPAVISAAEKYGLEPADLWESYGNKGRFSQ